MKKKKLKAMIDELTEDVQVLLTKIERIEHDGIDRRLKVVEGNQPLPIMRGLLKEMSDWVDKNFIRKRPAKRETKEELPIMTAAQASDDYNDSLFHSG